MLDTKLGYHLLNGDPCGSKSDKILLDERPRDISLDPITWPNIPCLPEREWRVSLLFILFREHMTESKNQ